MKTLLTKERNKLLLLHADKIIIRCTLTINDQDCIVRFYAYELTRITRESILTLIGNQFTLA